MVTFSKRTYCISSVVSFRVKNQWVGCVHIWDLILERGWIVVDQTHFPFCWAKTQFSFTIADRHIYVTRILTLECGRKCNIPCRGLGFKKPPTQVSIFFSEKGIQMRHLPENSGDLEDGTNTRQKSLSRWISYGRLVAKQPHWVRESVESHWEFVCLFEKFSTRKRNYIYFSTQYSWDP